MGIDDVSPGDHRLGVLAARVRSPRRAGGDLAFAGSAGRSPPRIGQQAGRRLLRAAPGIFGHAAAPREVIHFRYPDPREPYVSGLSPLRACWDQATLVSDYLGFKQATWRNSALPGVIVSPNEATGEDERDRLEKQWNQKFARGGAGKVLIAETGMNVSVLASNMGDLATLAEYGQTKEDIANAFHVPLSFLTSKTNLANLQAAEHQHLAKAIAPRLQRRDEKLNEQLVPLYDSSGRLFLASDDPVPFDHELGYRQQELDMKYGLLTINEVRRDRGLPPVAWGDQPWLPVAWAPTDFRTTLLMPQAREAKEPREEGDGNQESSQ